MDASGLHHLGTLCPEVVKTGERKNRSPEGQSSTTAASFLSRSDRGPHSFS